MRIPEHNDPLSDEQGELEALLKASFTRRLMVAAIVVFLGLMTLLSRMFYLQIMRYDYYRTRSQSNRIRIKAIVPERGIIYDRRGRPLSENILRHRVVIQPSQTPNIKATLEALQQHLALSDAEIADFLKQYRQVRRYESAVIKASISEEERYRLAEQLYRLEGVEIESYYERYYPYGALLTHIVGYTNRISEKDELDAEAYRGLQFIGRTGLEKQYEERLRGQSGYQQVETDANGNLIRVLEALPAVRGQDIYLSLDVDLQAFIDQAMNGMRGACVAIDTQTGAVLASVSKPSYDANLFTRGIAERHYQRLLNDPDTPLYNRAVKGNYAPGSVIKPILNLAGFYHHLVAPHSVVHCSGYYTIPDSSNKRRFHCWNRHGHGKVNADKALAQSCDIYYYTLGYQLGIERLTDFCAHFGLGQLTGIDLPDEGRGILPTRVWKEEKYRTPWFIGDTINASIGQGYMTTTPLQLAYMTALIARDGMSFTPHFLRRVYDPATKRFLSPEYPLPQRLPVYQSAAWKWVQKSMEHVIHSSYGTGKGIAEGLRYRIAGKSGTVQVVSFQSDRRPNAHEIKKEHRDNAMFIAYAPADKPRIALSVVVERGGSGSAAAAPLVRQILDYYLLRDEHESA